MCRKEVGVCDKQVPKGTKEAVVGPIL